MGWVFKKKPGFIPTLQVDHAIRMEIRRMLEQKLYGIIKLGEISAGAQKIRQKVNG